MKRKAIFFLFSCLFFLKGSAQCAMCRAVLESGEDQSAAEGINDGIMFLMAVPYILVGVLGYIAYRTYNKSLKPKNTEESV
ncbi:MULTISPECIES: hypothetical protein [Winogradskyella]|uniref:Uncharacterized protein n=1 Tax=Winogradskyella ouciana TaxID=2608631 RepID=A0A7K1GBY6_9FLAO|nr:MULTISPECIES: hypothetical protein [Winogradskyella]MBO6879823.1 hypothetical protein [Winogradskyella sp.]MTE26812.1 hypothetical protein [Winogradskyella ouciana]